MTTISELSDYLLYEVPDKAAELLALADMYIRAFNEAPEQFILPHDHAILLPLIERYHSNMAAFVLYVLGVRDSLPPKSLWHEAVHDLYRRLSGRYVQRVRRERMNRAMAKAVELYGDAPYDVKARWLRRLEKLWAQRRLAFLADWRRGRAHRTLSRTDQADALTEFWDMIEQEIANGERIPKWE